MKAKKKRIQFHGGALCLTGTLADLDDARLAAAAAARESAQQVLRRLEMENIQFAQQVLSRFPGSISSPNSHA